MSTTLSTAQASLTRSSNRLSTTCQDAQGILKTSRQDNPETQLRKVRGAKIALESNIQYVESAMARYISTADDLDSENIEKKVVDNVTKADDVIHQAQDMLTAVKQRIDEIQHEQASQPSPSTTAPEMTLAPLPIPTFTGRIWEWDSFWDAFDHAVHSKSIDDHFKMNYLLNALDGEAKESIHQYEVSAKTYSLVVAHLKRKYGDKDALIEELLRRLRYCSAKTERLQDQERLCEELTGIVNQLQLKGEHINNTFLQKILIEKFSASVQRAILRQKHQEPADQWNTTKLLSTAKDHITMELKINRQLEVKSDGQANASGYDGPLSRQRGFVCFYCSKPGHPPKSCTEDPTREKRLAVMKKNNLCQNCGNDDHATPQCKKGSCRRCKEFGHHTSICHELDSTTPQSPSTRTSNNKPRPSTATSANVHATSANHREPQIDSYPQTEKDNRSFEMLVLVGEAKVLNPTTQTLEAVHVLLDTGADRSFITQSLADRLRLKEVHVTQLTINTFGSTTPMRKTYGTTNVQIWDQNGNPHTFTVTKVEFLTEPMKRICINNEDKAFILDHDISLSLNWNATNIRPEILLGCSDVFSLLCKESGTQMTLPSGLQIIPSKLGYLVAGHTRNQSKTTHGSAAANAISTSISTSPVPKEQTDECVDDQSVQSQDELTERWEDFFTFESSGMHEFHGAVKEERRATNDAVWKTFKENIQRQDDGYYVSLP
ncbi:hypothetical protein Q1695_012062 [Nippostrongylus brasiliensis]|nr:hypothetical protein Q1695_012062 [Nippostrongylus brasiliensis]